MTRALCVILLLVGQLWGCSGGTGGSDAGGEASSTCPDGTKGCPCLQGLCQLGLVCWSDVCVDPNALDAGPDADVGVEAVEASPEPEADVAPDVPAEPAFEPAPEPVVEPVVEPDVVPEAVPEPAEVVPDVPFVPTCQASSTIVSPAAGAWFGPDEAATLSALVQPSSPGLSVSWRLPDGTEVAKAPVGGGGASVVTATLPYGVLQLRAQVVNADGPCDGDMASVVALACRERVSDDFASFDPVKWKVFDDAYWDAGGWIEMTGAVGDKKGAIYDQADDIVPGHVSVAFRLETGGGLSVYNGGDGMAMTIVDVDTPQQLESLIALAAYGGGLGYGVSGTYGDWSGNALTVEIDTWENVYNPGVGELHTDPTPDAHVALTLNGDAGNHAVWYATPNIEDLAWHDLRVDVYFSDVRVWLDDAVIIEATVPEMDFRGGYIFFSGSTGWVYNYHRFDDLRILHHCY